MDSEMNWPCKISLLAKYVSATKATFPTFRMCNRMRAATTSIGSKEIQRINKFEFLQFNTFIHYHHSVSLLFDSSGPSFECQLDLTSERFCQRLL